MRVFGDSDGKDVRSLVLTVCGLQEGCAAEPGGSCFLIAPQLAVTAKHVIEDIFETYSGRPIQIESNVVESLGRYTGSHQVDIAIELVDEDAFATELGSGHFEGEATRSLTRILIQLKPSGMNPATFCHELGESMFRAIQTVYGDEVLAVSHTETEQIMLDAWKFFMG